MRIGSGERVKIDFRKDLYNHMIEELMEYISTGIKIQIIQSRYLFR